MILRTLLIAVALLATALVGGMMSISAELQSFIWLPSGVGIAVALWFGLRALPGVFLGGGLIGWIFASGQGLSDFQVFVVTIGSAAGSLVEAHVGRLLVWRFINKRAEIETGSDLLGLILLAPIIATLNPSVVVAIQSLGRAGIWDDYGVLWFNMWVAGGLAIAFLTPLLLALRYRSRLQIGILGAILVAGTWVSYQLVISTSTQAHEAWESQALNEANQLTGLFFSALQNGYGDMRSIAVLMANQEVITEEEFQSAVGTLHANSEGFAPAAVLVVQQSGDTWSVLLSSDDKMGMTPGFDMASIDVARDAIVSSLEHGLVLGATAELLPGSYFGINAIPVLGTEPPMVVIGIQDVGEIDAMVAEDVGHGLGFAISSVHASGLTTEGRDHLYPEGKSSADALVTFDIPVTTAGATLTFHWGVVEEYVGGPSLDFSRAIFFGGPLITLLIAVAINMLFAQAGRIRRQVELRTAELKRQKAIADLALENMGEGILLVDAEGKIAAYNHLAVHYFGLTEEEVERYPVYRELLGYVYLEKHDLPDVYEERMRELDEGQAGSVDRHMPDGKILESRHHPVEGGGFVRVFLDVTETRQAAEELKEARMIAEDSARSKSEFLANMSHEIRTPMNAIIGMSDLALQTELTPKQHNYIDKVHRSAVGLLGIINDILDFSKIEAGKLELESLEFRLEDVLDKLVDLVGLRAEEKSLEFLLNVEPEVPRLLVGDPLRLEQILVNLCNNAIKFTEQGEVVVSIGVTEKEADSVQLQFSVRDTGIGMSVEEKARLFKAFSQADASTTRKFGGTGLGLTICKRLVDAMGGKISVQSKPDMGSTFEFEVGFGWEDCPESLPVARDHELGDLSVLAVDDNPTARTILRELVLSLGFRVDLAENGEAALNMAQAAQAQGTPYSVILMDWKMPGLDGVETIQGLVDRDLHSTTQTLLMVTAHGRDEAAEAGEGLPINGFLTKPLNPSTLLDAILVAQGREAIFKRRHGSKRDTEAASRTLAGAQVLLVEDNDINKELALELLTAAGVTADVAENGQLALDMIGKKSYDGVLMDIQMPVMDGYTATQHIRSNPDYDELPVIAMTANALVGDRERALEVGMNDHIAKPLNVADMLATMAKWISPSSPADAATPPVPEHATDSELPPMNGIDTQAGLATCAGKSALYRKLLRKFCDSNRSFEAEFREALADEDASAASRCAHTLKGTAASIGAAEVAAAAADLEVLCQSTSETAEIERGLTTLLQKLAPVLDAIEGAALDDSEVACDQNAGNIDTGALLAELRELLENSDTRAAETCESLRLGLPENQRALLDALAASIEGFDFDTALNQLADVEHELT